MGRGLTAGASRETITSYVRDKQRAASSTLPCSSRHALRPTCLPVHALRFTFAQDNQNFNCPGPSQHVMAAPQLPCSPPRTPSLSPSTPPIAPSYASATRRRSLPFPTTAVRPAASSSSSSPTTSPACPPWSVAVGRGRLAACCLAAARVASIRFRSDGSPRRPRSQGPVAPLFATGFAPTPRICAPLAKFPFGNNAGRSRSV